MALGYSFTPGLANRFRAAANGQNPFGNTGSQALQVLSLHLPDQAQGHLPAPEDLLRAGGGLTPDTAVRAQTSGIAMPVVPPPASAMGSPPLNPSPLAIATPGMAALTAQALMPQAPSSPFTGTAPDTGPGADLGPGQVRVQFGTSTPTDTGAEAPSSTSPQDLSGLSSFLDSILQSMR